jgi:endonuclease-3
MPPRRTVKTTGQKPSQRAPLVARSPRTKADRQHIATVTLERLLKEYPDAHCELDFRNPFELVAATILSAQCTDVRVNMVTPVLFKKYPNAKKLSAADSRRRRRDHQEYGILPREDKKSHRDGNNAHR